MTNEEQAIDDFLNQIKAKIQVFGIVFRPREKNLETLATLDIKPIDRINFILNLLTSDYYRGPTPDTYDTSKPDYYEFGINIKSKEIYIKIALNIPNKPVDCMSFHIAEHPIQYLYKK